VPRAFGRGASFFESEKSNRTALASNENNGNHDKDNEQQAKRERRATESPNILIYPFSNIGMATRESY